MIPYLLVLLILVSHQAAGKHCPRDFCTCVDGPTSDIFQLDCSNQDLYELPSMFIAVEASSVDLNHNKLSAITKNTFWSNRGLISLNISYNQITNIEDESFKFMTRLDILDLSFNKLRTLRLGVFSGLQSLKELSLAHNELVDIEGALSNMMNLTKLDLSDNRLMALTEFTLRDLRSLRYLHLSSNLFQSIDRKAFRNQQKLLYLVLRNNPLNIQRFYFQSTMLSYVDLSECQLTQVPSGLSDSIRYLQLRRNNITRLFADSFADCPYVNILVLDENQLTAVDDATFEKMYHLQQLWLNDNQLERLPRALPPSLRRLLADGNKIKEVENVFPQRSQMSMMSLVGNEIRQVEKDAFEHLVSLHNLDLSDNFITHIYSGTFTQNSQLRSLRYSKNPIRVFSPGCFSGLTDLQSLSLGYVRRNLERISSEPDEDDPSNNKIEIYSNLFNDIQRLQRLELDNSPTLISVVLSSQRLLSGLRSLIELSVTGSDLTSVPPDFINSLPSLAAIRISSSKWHCDRSMIWFRDFLKSTRLKIDDKEELKCFTPRLLHGRPIISLRDDEFAYVTGSTLPIVTKLLQTTRQPDLVEEVQDNKPYREEGWMEYEVMEPDKMPGRDGARGQHSRKNKERRKNERGNNKERDNTDIDSDADSVFLIAISRPSENAPITPVVWEVGVEPADKERESKRKEDRGDGEFELRIMVAVVTIVITCVIAAVIVALIIYVWNRQQQQIVDDADLSAAAIAAEQQLQQKEQHERTVISYKNKSGVLYFSSSSSGGSRGSKGRTTAAAAAELRCEEIRGGDSSSSSQSLLPSQSTTPTLVTSSHSLPEVHLINKPAKYYKTRVYKWEDF